MLEVFRVVCPGPPTPDGVYRHVQHDTLGRSGHKDADFINPRPVASMDRWWSFGWALRNGNGAITASQLHNLHFMLTVLRGVVPLAAPVAKVCPMNRVWQQLAPVVRDILLNSVVNGRLTPYKIRRTLLNAVGHEIDSTAVVSADLFLGARRGLNVGSGSFINYGCFMDLGAPTVIGRRVTLAYGVMLITCSHAIGGPAARTGDGFAKPIAIGDGSWIGARATILPGVTIGAGCVIAAGSVVTTDCEAHTLYAGVPARKVRQLASNHVR